MILNSNIYQQIRYGDPLIAGRDLFFINNRIHIDGQLFTKKFPRTGAGAFEYLKFVEQNIPQNLISKNNFDSLKNIAGFFDGNSTSFLGFESILNSSESKSDYSMAISSYNGERESFADLVKKDNFLNGKINLSKWSQIKNFTQLWKDPCSDLYNNILGIWFEFDIINNLSKFSIPAVFINTIPIARFKSNKSNRYDWLLNETIPILQGKNLSKKVENKILECIKKLPPNASIYQFGVMLSRSIDGIRLVIKRINLKEIIPYLESIGWKDDSGELKNILNDLHDLANRFVLNIHVSDKIHLRIGIECSFYPNLYNKETRWQELLNYFIKKELCNPEKCSALLNFPGLQCEDVIRFFDIDRSFPITKMTEKSFTKAISRFISHIKINFEPFHPTEIKAYYAIRMLGVKHESFYR